jgi:hypothetical protein
MEVRDTNKIWIGGKKMEDKERDISQPFHAVGVSSQNMNFRSFSFYRTAVEEKLFDGTVW